jgi:uncharacterized membrane protein
MSEMETHNPKSTAKIAGHPLHPMVVPFPIAFFVSTLVTDLIYRGTGRAGFADASMWLLGAGLAGALLAAVLGLTDFLSEPRVRALREAWLHMGGNVVVVVLQAINIGLRASSSFPGVTVAQTALSALVVALLLFTGWMGWAMVYRGHVGVADDREIGPARLRA